MSLTQERLRDLLSLSSDGRFYWRHDRGSRARAGEQAGSLQHNGYWAIRIDGVSYYEHRLVWLWHHGSFPEGRLDHDDINFWNNRIGNLRVATASQNGANARLSISNSSTVKGVSWNKRLQKWHAYIGKDGKRKHLGFFDQLKDAASAYRTASITLFGEFARPISDGNLK